MVPICSLAVQYRQQFGKDILLDITGYRRHGHNEVQPAPFTRLAQRRVLMLPVVAQ